MEELSASAVVYLPAEEVYEFLVDFPRYARYSEYLAGVDREGDGSAGTRYALHFEWWKLSLTARSEVTGLDPPRQIDWRLVSHLDASGRWLVDPLDAPPTDAPAGAEAATRVTFEVAYDPGSVEPDAVSLPPLVSLDRVVARLSSLVVPEIERIVERVVADLEGRRRPVEITVRGVD